MKKTVKISLILNITVAVMTVIALTMGLFGLTFVPHEEEVGGGIIIFKYFTVQANVLAGIASCVFAVYEIKMLTGKIGVIPKWIYSLKYASSIGVTITFLTVALYLAPISEMGYFYLFMDSNIFFHFLIPLTTFIGFVFFEHAETSFKHTLFGFIHFFIYGIVYMSLALTHIENGEIPLEYNWYLLASPDPTFTLTVIFIMCVATYLVSVLVWLLNKKIKL